MSEQLLNEAIADLAGRDEAELLQEAARRMYAIGINPELSSDFLARDIDRTQAQGGGDALAIAQRVLKFASRALHDLCCTPEGNASIRQAFEDLLPQGERDLARFIALFLVSQLGLAPAIASVVGYIIAKHLIKAAKESVCDAWAEANKSL